MFHLISTTDGVLMIDNELLALADTVVVSLPYITFQPYNINVL